MRAPRQHDLALRPRSRKRTQPPADDLDAGLRALLGEEGPEGGRVRRKHPETGHGSPGVSRQVGDTQDRASADRFTKETADRTGQSERTIQRSAERGEEERAPGDGARAGSDRAPETPRTAAASTAPASTPHAAPADAAGGPQPQSNVSRKETHR